MHPGRPLDFTIRHGKIEGAGESNRKSYLQIIATRLSPDGWLLFRNLKELMRLDGWVKIHRKILENDVFQFDHTAWHVFLTLLLLANRTTGDWKGGRYQLAEWAGLKSSTTYKAIKRLEIAKMVTTKSSNKFTVYQICSWSKYQLTKETFCEVPVTTKEQQSNTQQEERSKEYNVSGKFKEFIRNKKTLVDKFK